MSQVTQNAPITSATYDAHIDVTPGSLVTYLGYNVNPLLMLILELPPQEWHRLMDLSINNLIKAAASESYKELPEDYYNLKMIRDAFADIRKVTAESNPTFSGE